MVREDTLPVRLKKFGSNEEVEHELRIPEFLVAYIRGGENIFGEIVSIDRATRKIVLEHTDIRKLFYWKDVEEAWLLSRPKDKKEMKRIESFLVRTVGRRIAEDALGTLVIKLIGGIPVPLVRLNENARIETKLRSVWGV